MLKLYRNGAILLVFALTVGPLAAQVVSIPANADYKRPKGAKALVVTLRGEVDTIPMFGAQVVMRSGNFGQVTLSPQSEFSDAELLELKAWREKRARLQIQGTLLTVCSERELQADIMGCRVMDRSKPMTLRLSTE